MRSLNWQMVLFYSLFPLLALAAKGQSTNSPSTANPSPSLAPSSVAVSTNAAPILDSALPPFVSGVWPSTPPSDCPFPPSTSLSAISFTGRSANWGQADTWFPSWASDGKLYSPFADGVVNGMRANCSGRSATTGSIVITGDDPLHLKFADESVYASDPKPYGGRYPCGSLVYNGVWYYGTYCLDPQGFVVDHGQTYNWPWLGPFVGFRYSTDFGKTWIQTPCTPDHPLFGEAALHGEPIKIGAPHFVDFGKNMEHSPDGYAYLVAQGASDGANRRYAYNSWITADEVYLLRVKPSIENMNDASKYQFFAGNDVNGKPIWSGDFSKIQPMASWRDNMGCVTMTYDAPLKKYLMIVTDGAITVSYFNTYVVESDSMTGPWKLVTYLKHFGEEAYFVNIPSKFIGADGCNLWLCYSANFSNWKGVRLARRPAGSGYSMTMQEVNLLAPGAAPATAPAH